MTALALLATALLFGGAVLFSFGFAVFLLKNTEEREARRLLRAAFPHFYALMIGMSALAAALVLPSDRVSAGILAAIALTTIFARQVLMPQVNAATDAGDKGHFGRLHGASVVLGLVQIAGMVWVLLRFL